MQFGVEVALEAAFEFFVNDVGDAVEVALDFSVSAGDEFNASQVNQYAFALDFTTCDFQGIGPGSQGIVGSQRFDAVIAVRVIRGQVEIGRVQLDGFLIKRERFVEDMGFVDAIKLTGVFAKKENQRGQIPVVDGLIRIERD